MKNTYEIRGEVVVIFLHRKDGTVLETVIDISDFPLVNSFQGCWRANYCRPSNCYYVNMSLNSKAIALHRLLLGFPNNDVDHVDRKTLNNRRNNLKERTHARNVLNRGIQPNSTTGVTGVRKRKDTGKFSAYIELDGKRRYLGCYNTLEEAAILANNSRKEALA